MIASIAQLATDNAAPVLFTYGPMGVILAWFMLRGEKVVSKIADLSHRVDGLTKAMLVDMIERESAGPHVKQFARDAIAKIDARAARDEKGR